jgi:hypothetical protein
MLFTGGIPSLFFAGILCIVTLPNRQTACVSAQYKWPVTEPVSCPVACLSTLNTAVSTSSAIFKQRPAESPLCVVIVLPYYPAA